MSVAPDLRRVVAVLSLSQVVSWGVLYYGFAVLQSAITRHTGWSATSVTAAFSLSQVVNGVVGLWVGLTVGLVLAGFVNLATWAWRGRHLARDLAPDPGPVLPTPRP